jgi:hypothetical protein
MSFFDELEKLQLASPRPALHNKNCENSEYGNFCIYNKNSYMNFATDFVEDCFYCRWVIKGRDNGDCTNSHDLELCYECTSCRNCYNCNYLLDCENCTDCQFCFDCIGCNDCFGCVGLRHKKFYIFNKPYSEAEYREKVAELSLDGPKKITDFLSKLEKIRETMPHVYGHFKKVENVIGDYVYNSRNCFSCYDVKESESSAYLNEGWKAFECYDTGFFGECTECYECMIAYQQNNCLFCWYCFGSSNLEYSEYCMSCQDCFGCFNLSHKQYYILNKPYEKEAYFKEVARIKKELKSRGEYGTRFLPSTYKFEDTLAADL